MTPTETIKWIAVPNGLDGSGNLQLSVLVTPELSGGGSGTLADFPDFQDWPATLSGGGLHWNVQFSADGDTQSIAVPFSATGLNSALWQILFPSTLAYAAADHTQEQFRNLAIASYPVGQVAGFLQGQYAQYSLTDVPTLSTLSSVFGPIADVLVGVTAQERMSALAADREARSKGHSVPHANDFRDATAADAFAAQAYYHMPGAGSPPVPEVPAIDFHRALTFIGQHGVLQRALALVFDLVVLTDDVRAISSTLRSDLFVSVSPSNANAGVPFSPGYTAVTPRTQCDASTTVFTAHSATGQIDAGQLTVGDPTAFAAHVIDFDGAGLRAAAFATQIHLRQAPAALHERYAAAAVADDPATQIAPPMIRSNGLTLTQVNRGVSVASLLSRAFLLYDAVVQSNPVPDLTAEDLVRGYVLDVLDTAGTTWRSTAEWLCTYVATSPHGSPPTQTITGPAAPPFSESSTQAPPRVQSSPTDPTVSQANVSEVILRYNGWSNAVGRPGTVLQDADSQVTSASPVPFSQLSITVAPPPGRLPRLRFGHTYALRARVIDVANNAIAVTAGASVGDAQGRVTAPMVYGRHEPIGSPDVYRQSVPRPGESLLRLVIRDLDTGTASVRAFAPQRCAEPFAEWHGLFDTGGGALNNSQATYALITSRESAQYPDLPSDPATAPTPIGLTTAVPFLPDPLARGGVLRIQDGTLAGQAVGFDFSPAPGGAWPDYRPFGLQLTPTGDPPAAAAQTIAVDTAGRLITCALTAGDTITMTLTATCDPADIALLGLTSWVSLDADLAAAGQYWAITPAATLELIYAVAKPLLTPELPSLPTPARALGDTFAPLAGEIRYSPKSTSTIDLLADWGDPVDDPMHDLPVQGPGAPDVKLRQTTSTPVVTMPSAVSPLASTGSQLYSATDTFTARHEFYDTKHRAVTYHAVATSQFSEFYASGTDVKQATVAPVLVDIPSSARPDTPDIADLIPIHGWQRHDSGHTTRSERSPAALRVFIDRPWWSSGIGELLGVVTWPGAEPRRVRTPIRGREAHRRTGGNGAARPIGSGGVRTAIPPDEALYVSDWGADPVFAGHALPSLHPRMGSFPSATAFATDLAIEESASVTVNVAGHPVRFDTARDLWYCDIAVDAGAAYTPMVRLALARFQPSSVAGAELSRIVLADIMTLDPGRTATVVRKSATTLASVTLSGYSYAHAAGAADVAPGAAEVIIERRQPAIQDETLGWEQVGSAIAMAPVGRGGGMTAWVARDIALPSHGTLRLCINQYEVLPTDNRSPTRGFYRLLESARELRLLHQDLIGL